MVNNKNNCPIDVPLLSSTHYSTRDLVFIECKNCPLGDNVRSYEFLLMNLKNFTLS